MCLKDELAWTTAIQIDFQSAFQEEDHRFLEKGSEVTSSSKYYKVLCYNKISICFFSLISVRMLSLQGRLSHVSSEIEDVLLAIKLNLQALAVRLDSSPGTVNQKINHCLKLTDGVGEKLQQREKCRLEYLISEQIREEEAKVRRQRLTEYQQKIQDQRRLISDKEGFYESLLRPRKKKPPNMSIEEWSQQRRGELRRQQADNLAKLQEQSSQMRKIERRIRQDNEKLQKWIKQAEEGIEIQQLEEALDLISKYPCLYPTMSLPSAPKSPSSLVSQLPYNCVELLEQYNQEKQLLKYLQWENTKLKIEYQKIETARKTNKITTKKQQKSRFNRAISL